MRHPGFKLVQVGVDKAGLPEMAVESDETRLTEAERRMEACRPKVRLVNCGGCARPLINEIDARKVRKLAEAVRVLFPQDTPAGRVKGRPACRTCIRPKVAHPAPAVPPPSPSR